MKVMVFSAKSYDKEFLSAAFSAQSSQIETTFFDLRLGPSTVILAKGYEAICIFVNDVADSGVIRSLKEGGTQLILLRCAGFNNVDLLEAKKLGIKVMRVPAYSPYAVAEHAVALLLSLNRKIPKAVSRVKEQNFSLEGLLGFDIHGKTIGVLGTGKIGQIFANIMKGFGVTLIGYDVFPNEELAKSGLLKYVPLDELLSTSDVISIHVPLLPSTHHMINAESIKKLKKGAMIINTSRGALLDTKAVINGLKTCEIGFLGLDVYEEEADLFFENLSDRILQDDVFARLLTFPNVIITGHQAFFTREAQQNIADTTVSNTIDFQTGKDTNELTKTVEVKQVVPSEEAKIETRKKVVAASDKSWSVLSGVTLVKHE